MKEEVITARCTLAHSPALRQALPHWFDGRGLTTWAPTNGTPGTMTYRPSARPACHAESARSAGVPPIGAAYVVTFTIFVIVL